MKCAKERDLFIYKERESERERLRTTKQERISVTVSGP